MLSRLLGLRARYPSTSAAIIVLGALGAGAYLLEHLVAR